MGYIYVCICLAFRGTYTEATLLLCPPILPLKEERKEPFCRVKGYTGNKTIRSKREWRSSEKNIYFIYKNITKLI